jgi:VIT1/CCC1 family predicted Fe2+/Mn2+ transporter
VFAGYNPTVLRQGPIPFFAHGLIEYAAGVVLIVAPFVLGFDSGAATAVAIASGVAVIFIAASTDGPVSLSNSIPVPVHFLLDFLLAAFFIASPFLFGYSDETAPTAFFIAIGVVHLLVTVGTRFLKGEREPRHGLRRRRAEPPPAA